MCTNRRREEENDLDKLQSEMAKVVSPEPAATLMRHLSPTPWPEVATKADLAAAQAATKADIGELRTDFVKLDAAVQVGFANLEASLIQKVNIQTITMIFALVGVVASISSVALFR